MLPYLRKLKQLPDEVLLAAGYSALKSVHLNQDKLQIFFKFFNRINSRNIFRKNIVREKIVIGIRKVIELPIIATIVQGMLKMSIQMNAGWDRLSNPISFAERTSGPNKDTRW